MVYKMFYYIYLKFIRVWLSPLLYYLIRYTIYLNWKFPDIWSKIRILGREFFEIKLNKYSYRWDYRYGIIDFSAQDPNFFFIRKRKYFRDCDDYARMWYWWAKEKGYKCWEVCIWKKFKRAHFITVFEENGNYYLCDYKLKGKFSSMKEAVESVEGFDDWIVYKEGNLDG